MNGLTRYLLLITTLSLPALGAWPAQATANEQTFQLEAVRSMNVAQRLIGAE